MFNLVFKLVKARDLPAHKGHPAVSCLLLSDISNTFNKEAFTSSNCEEFMFRVLPKPHPRLNDLAYLVVLGGQHLNQGFSIQMLVAVV